MVSDCKVWIDTNIIIRFITADHARMTAETAQLMAKAEQGAMTLKVAAMIVAECCWVLESSHYGFSKSEIAAVLASFLTAKGIEAEEENVVINALETYAEQNIDFIDAYLAEHAKARAPGYIITYNASDFKKLDIQFDDPTRHIEECSK